MTPVAIAAALASLSSFPVHAQSANNTTAALQLNQVVVTAARVPMQLSDVVADVTVINRADIERQGYGDLSDLLRNSGAVQIVRNGGVGSTTTLMIRGAESRHTMVLIDGVRVDTQSTAGAPWETIPTSQIERIEIVKGPASAIYGSDAIGGVVQIITRKGDGALKADVGIAGGSLGTARADASVRGSTGMFDYAVGAATEHAKGFQLITDTSSPYYVAQDAAYQKHSASVRLGAQLGAQDRLEFIALNSHLSADFNSSYPPPASLFQAIEDTSTRKLGWTRQWTKGLSTQFSVGESKERYDDPGDFYVTETHTRSYAFDSSWRMDAQQQLLFVLERREDKLIDSSLSAAGVADRSDNGAALGYIGKFGRLDLQAHARHDRNSEFGSANTGSLGVGFALSPGLRVVASAANAFRAPTIYQNSSESGPLSLAGGKSLVPESGHNVEIGLKYLGTSADASVTAYRNNISNLINFDFSSTTTCIGTFGGCYVNVSQARLQGLSFAGNVQTGPVTLSGTLDLQSPKDVGTGLLRAGRARRFGTLHAQTELQGWDLSTGLLFSSERFNAANTVKMGGYALLNVDASYPLTRELKLQLNLDNAFNRKYETAVGYAQAPRTVMVGLRYSPGL